MAGTFTFTPSPQSGKNTKTGRPPYSGQPFIEYLYQPPDPNDTLLGNRFLCIEGTLLIVGPSGIGKSSSDAQMGLFWSCCREAFGITPSRPLVVVEVQAEDDPGDLHFMARGITKLPNVPYEEMVLDKALIPGFSPEETEQIRTNYHYYSCKSRTGAAFLKEVIEPLLQKHRPDIIRINPLQAYLGGDPADTELTADFLRNGLNQFLEKYHCAGIIIHHTPKTTNRDTTEWKASDWMYAGAGAADITNWARAIIVIDPTKEIGIFKFIAAKRGRWIGWRDAVGAPVETRYFAWEKDSIKWRDATDSEIKAAESGRKQKATPDDVLVFVPATGEIAKQDLYDYANINGGIGITTAKSCVGILIKEGRLFQRGEPRRGTREKLFVSRFAYPAASDNGERPDSMKTEAESGNGEQPDTTKTEPPDAMKTESQP